MRIVIEGIGQTGSELAKELINAGHEIIVIDIRKEAVEEFTNNYDAIGVVGSGASRKVQQDAKVNNADVFIALTSIDEVNFMSCITAKNLGAKYTIARLITEEYKDDENYLTHDLKIDLIVNSEYDTAKEITRIIGYPSDIKTGAFANGKVDIAEIKVKEDSILTNMKLTDLKLKLKSDVIVASILRNGIIIVPRGEAVIEKDDVINVIGKSGDIYHLLKKLNLIDKPIKSVFMIGCGKIGEYLLDTFPKMNLKLKVVESDKEHCIELAQKYPDINIINGNGIDPDMLLEEGIQNYDACISLTGVDETNLVVTLFAWSYKIRKTITKIVSVNYTKMLNNIEINNVLSPHLIILSGIHRFIRGIDNTKSNSSENTIKSIYRFAGNMLEAVELEVQKDKEYLGKNLKEIKIKRDVVIAFILRKRKAIIPNGMTTIEAGDRIIVISEASKNIARIEDIIE